MSMSMSMRMSKFHTKKKNHINHIVGKYLKKRVHSQLYLLHISTDPSYRAPAVINLGRFPPTWLCPSVPTFKWLPANVLKSLCSTSRLPRGLPAQSKRWRASDAAHARTDVRVFAQSFSLGRRGYMSACMHTPRTQIFGVPPRALI